MLQVPQPLGVLGLVLDSQDEQSRAMESNRFGIAGWNGSGTVSTSTSSWVQPAAWQTTAMPGATGNILLTIVVTAQIPAGNSQRVIQVGVAIDGGSPIAAATWIPGSAGSPYNASLFGYVPAPGLSQGVTHTFQFAVAGDGLQTYIFSSPAMAVWPL